jgi:DNA-binding transcriptional regulator YdaS (Cro superfamily)
MAKNVNEPQRIVERVAARRAVAIAQALLGSNPSNGIIDGKI